jgi:cytochrome b6-f complex iron-sulfur subunit
VAEERHTCGTGCRAELPKNSDRRSFFHNGWNWVRLVAIGVLCHPILRFLGYRVTKKPRRVLVAKTMPLAGFLQEMDFVLFEDERGPWAVSRVCTHLGRRLNYLAKEGQLVCPCHQSRFTPDGKRVDGPARRDLIVFPVEEMPEKDGKGYVVII